MSKIIKICKKHGELTIDKVLKSFTSSGKYFSYRCKECRRTQNKLSKRGCSNEIYENLKNIQQGKCAICKKEETMISRSKEILPLYVDHCHGCKSHIRELLCSSCNTGLGKSYESIEILKNAILYLKKHI